MAKSRLKSALSFSHLIGSASAGRSARRAEDDDQNNTPPGADDGDEDDDANTPSGRRARGDDDDTNPGDDDNGDTPSSRRARGEGDDDDDDTNTPSGRRRARGDDTGTDEEGDDEDEEDNEDPKAKAARKRERARCAAIFATKAAANRPDLAAHLAFNTSLPRSEAKALLKASAQGSTQRGGVLADAMAQFGQQRVSAGAPGVSRQASINASWDAAARKAGVTGK